MTDEYLTLPEQVLKNKNDIEDLKNVDKNTYTKEQIDAILQAYQLLLESGVNIKTINNQSILGAGNINVDSTYVLPQANATTLGGIKANPKTADDTQEVHIDSLTGQLFTKAGGGGTGSGSKLYLHTFTMNDDKTFGIVMTSSKVYTELSTLIQDQQTFISFVFSNIEGKSQAFLGFTIEAPNFNFITYDSVTNSIITNTYSFTSATFTDNVVEITNL